MSISTGVMTDRIAETSPRLTARMAGVSPAFAAHLLPYILVPSGIAEASLGLWLLVIGVNAQRWKEQATDV